MFQAVTGIAVSLIPEGLPALITITLAIGVQRMAQRNAIIRRLPAVETLGSVSRICSDKTGTLTLMEMMVDLGRHRRRNASRSPATATRREGEVHARTASPSARTPVLELMGRVSALCNDAELFAARTASGRSRAIRPRARSIRSRPSSASTGRRSRPPLPASTPSRSSPSTSSWRRCTRPRTGGEMLLVKGAPEVILDHCDRQQTARGKRRAARPRRISMQGVGRARRAGRAGAGAWRGCPIRACKAGSLGPADLPKTLVLLGLVGLIDPPRKEAIEAVKECHGGGIRVTMITGDHKITAAAIAKMLGIGDGKTAVTGAEIEEMDTATLQETRRATSTSSPARARSTSCGWSRRSRPTGRSWR